MSSLDIVVPGQFTDLSDKGQLFALGNVLRELTDSIESAAATVINVNNTTVALSSIAQISYPFL